MKHDYKALKRAEKEWKKQYKELKKELDHENQELVKFDLTEYWQP
jgi:hypothetical protein